MYAADNAKEKSIAIWLNGGPGSSSTLANFMFNGPMRIDRTGDGPSDFRVHLASEGSWTETATMIYVD